MNRTEVYKRITAEREYQDGKWGGEAHDKKHSVGNFLIYMEKYMDEARHAMTMSGDEKALDQLRKVVALGVACFEVHGVPRR